MKVVGGTCVLLGNLNPAILRPDWIVKHQILADGEWQSELGLGPAGVSMKFTMADLTWTATPERLQVDAKSADADPGAFVAGILEQLVHTPVRAVGNNFELSAPQTKSLDSVLSSDFLDRVVSDDTLVNTTLGLKLSHGGAIVNFNLDFDNSSCLNQVRLNFHRDAKDVSAAVDAANQWSSDRSEAAKMSDRLEAI